jgi:4-hydroxybenzoate polyprenyltransferase
MSSAESALRAPHGGAGARLSGWLTLARVSNTPTVVSNVLAGAAVAGVLGIESRVVLLMVAMVAFYTAGMLLNDLCDYRWDLEHRPDRPLVTGLVSRSAVTLVTSALFGVGAALLWLVGPGAFVGGVVLIGLIALYDVWHKTNPLSPLVMAGCRVMVYVTAFAAFAWPPTLGLYVASAAMVVYLVGLTTIAKSGRYPGAVIARLIAGISILDAVVLALSGAGLALIAIAVLCGVLTLGLQRWVEGT